MPDNRFPHLAPPDFAYIPFPYVLAGECGMSRRYIQPLDIYSLLSQNLMALLTVSANGRQRTRANRRRKAHGDRVVDGARVWGPKVCRLWQQYLDTRPALCRDSDSYTPTSTIGRPDISPYCDHLWKLWAHIIFQCCANGVSCWRNRGQNGRKEGYRERESEWNRNRKIKARQLQSLPRAGRMCSPPMWSAQ